MIKIKTLIVALVSMLCFSGLALASSDPMSEPKVSVANQTKVGIVDVNKILFESKQVQELKEKLKKEFHGRDAAILKAEKQLSASMKKLKRDASVMKPQARKKMQDDIIAQNKSLHALQMSFQKDLYQAKEEGMNKILEQLRQTIEQVSHQQGMNLVLTKNAIGFSEPSYDITAVVASAFKNKS